MLLAKELSPTTAHALELSGADAIAVLCPFCTTYAVVKLTPAQLAQQPDGTTHVCHPTLGGCNHGFAMEADSPSEGRAYVRDDRGRRRRRSSSSCPDCGKPGERAGHQDCQFPQDH